MDEPPRAPIEWVPGRSRAPWVLAFAVLFTVAFEAAYWSLMFGLSWAGPLMVSPRLTLVLQFAAVAIAFGPGLLLVLVIPYPASRLGVSPEGVTVDHGLRSDFWPWSRAIVRGNRLHVYSARLGLHTQYALTPFQAYRAAALRPIHS